MRGIAAALLLLVVGLVGGYAAAYALDPEPATSGAPAPIAADPSVPVDPLPTISARPAVTSLGTDADEALTSWRVPPTEVRRWTGDITLHEGMVVVADATLLPESFKWFEHEPLANERLRDITPRFARLRNDPPHRSSASRAATTSSSTRTPATTAT